jgi:autotransporter-associated beta strand protein
MASLNDYPLGGGSGGTVTNSASGAVTLTLGANDGSTATFSGTISDNPSGALSLVKSGNFTQVLAGSNTFTGTTTVNGGTLAVNGSLSNIGPVNLYGGVLSGSGSVGNVATHGGTVAPGYIAGAGTLNAASLFLNPGPLDFTLGASAGGNGFINVANGVVTLATTNNDISVNLVSGGSLVPGTYGLISYGTLSAWPGGGTGVPSTAFSVSNSASFSGDTFSFTATNNVIDLVISASVSVINGQWATNGGGAWSGTANWTGGVPGTGQDTAVFGTALTSGTAAVTLDGSRSLSSLGFGTTGGASYTISASAGAALTMANTGGLAATISNSGGNHTITAPIVLGSNLSVTATAGSALTIAQSISNSSGGSYALSVSGGGELILSGTDTYSGGTTVNGGTLAVTAASALPSSGLLTISGGGRIVLGSGSGIGALLGASSPITSGAVVLAAASSLPVTIESPSGNMATLGGAPAISQGVAGSAVGGSAAAVPEPGTIVLLATGALTLAAVVRRKRRCR